MSREVFVLNIIHRSFQLHLHSISFPSFFLLFSLSVLSHFRPIFIVNTVHDIENEEVIECTTKSENCSSDREINNNISNTFYLQRDGEDKRDKSDKKSQQKTVKFSRVEEVVVISRRDSGDKLMKMLEIDVDEVPNAPTAADKSDTQKIDDTGKGSMSTSNNEIPAKRRRDASDSEILKTEPNVNRNNSITPPRLSAVSSSGVSTNARPPPPPPPTRAAVVTAAVESSSSSIGESPLFFYSYDLCYAKSDACAAHSSKRLRRTQSTKMESCKLLFYSLSCCP